jgi:hypothetical protein
MRCTATLAIARRVVAASTVAMAFFSRQSFCLIPFIPVQTILCVCQTSTSSLIAALLVDFRGDKDHPIRWGDTGAKDERFPGAGYRGGYKNQTIRCLKEDFPLITVSSSRGCGG